MKEKDGEPMVEMGKYPCHKGLYRLYTVEPWSDRTRCPPFPVSFWILIQQSTAVLRVRLPSRLVFCSFCPVLALYFNTAQVPCANMKNSCPSSPSAHNTSSFAKCLAFIAPAKINRSSGDSFCNRGIFSKFEAISFCCAEGGPPPFALASCTSWGPTCAEVEPVPGWRSSPASFSHGFVCLKHQCG